MTEYEKFDFNAFEKEHSILEVSLRTNQVKSEKLQSLIGESLNANLEMIKGLMGSIYNLVNRIHYLEKRLGITDEKKPFKNNLH